MTALDHPWLREDQQWRNLATGASTPADDTGHRMQIGAALGLTLPGRGTSYGIQYDADVGPITVVRTYDSGLSGNGPTGADTVATPLAVDRGWDIFLSIKPGGESTATYNSIAAGDWDTQVQNYVNAWPAGVGGYLSIGNEPDQNSKDVDPAAFCAAVEHLAGVLVLPPGVRLAVSLMTWSWYPSNPRPYAAQWLPDVPGLHISVHGYGRDNWDHPSGAFGRVVSTIPEGYTWGIGEINAHEHPTDPNRKAQWFLTTSQWAYDNGALHYLIFDTGTGPISGEHNITRSSPEATAAAKLIAETYN